MIETECPWFWKKILHVSCYSQARPAMKLIYWSVNICPNKVLT